MCISSSTKECLTTEKSLVLKLGLYQLLKKVYIIDSLLKYLKSHFVKS